MQAFETSQQFQLLLTIKLRRLQNSGYEGVSYDDLYRVFTRHIWRHKQPERLSELADEILNISDQDIVRWLAVDSTIQGFKSSLDDFASLLEYEEL